MIDQSELMSAILATDASPLARETAAGLVEAYVERYGESDRERFRVLDVERPWHLWLDDLTLLIGCKDAEFDDGQKTPLMGEWKTHKEARRTKAGEYYKGEGPLDWLSQISNGPQLGIYALHKVETSGAEYARIMVRAAIKSTPIEFWPPKEEDGIFILNREYLAFLRNALLVRASEIRTARCSGLTPWDWVGYKCHHMYGKTCQFFEPFCKEHKHPTGTRKLFNFSDPGSAAIRVALADRGFLEGVPAEDGGAPHDLVILSASAYEDYSTCRERGRIIQDGFAGGDESIDLQIGSCYHSGLAAFYRGLIVPNPSLEAVAQNTTES